jgi:leucyl aminopeptidase
MPVEISATRSQASRPVWLVAEKSDIGSLDLPQGAVDWAKAHGFEGRSGALQTFPGADGRLAGALFGTGKPDGGHEARLLAGKLARLLPAGDWHIEGDIADPDLAALAFLLGGYVFTRYRKAEADRDIRLALPLTDENDVRRQADAVFLARDLVNTPANDMGPAALEAAIRDLGASHGAAVTAIVGDDLLRQNFPMIHAVGRAGAEAPRLVDLQWGDPNHPAVTLVGKGVCFDTGGLDIKPSSGMLLMKKDMGGAANVIALASMVMGAKLPVRLRVLVPAVENAIAGNAFRPGDILRSRSGVTVEIGNTDAEGRLVLADALALADETTPELLIDMATLTGAARVALGPDLPPFYTDDPGLAAELSAASSATADPLWRMPLWSPYEARLSSRFADINNVTTDGFAGSITAALFLKRFVRNAATWAHFDIFAWTPVEKPHAPVGGEAQGIRALYHALRRRYPPA